MEKNNLFQYATKELSQDAFFCWLINWINYPDAPMYPAGVAALNLFLGKNKQKDYTDVEVLRQYKKIDVLVLFNKKYALIIEDKTNTTEHGEQIARYKNLLQEDYPDREIFTAYVKTGIMYDEDARIINKVDAVVTLNDLLNTFNPIKEDAASEIFSDYLEYISTIAEERRKINRQIETGEYSRALDTYFGQFSFMDRIFANRTKGTEIGKTYTVEDKNPPVLIDQVYAGTNNGGTPWIQYCFWGQAYPEQIKQVGTIEYQYLFWRIDCNWVRRDKSDPNSEYDPEYYIALRHYDENTKVNDYTRQRKKTAYYTFRNICKEIENGNPAIFKPIGTRENYKESDLLFIPLNRIETMTFDEVKRLLTEITTKILMN